MAKAQTPPELARLYRDILILFKVNRNVPGVEYQRPSPSASSSNSKHQDALAGFYDKLSKSCDCELKGLSTTTILVLKGEVGPRYVLFVNSSKEPDRGKIKRHIEGILEILSSSTLDYGEKSHRVKMIQKICPVVFGFLQPRISNLFKQIHKKCREIINESTDEELRSLANTLKGLTAEASGRPSNQIDGLPIDKVRKAIKQYVDKSSENDEMSHYKERIDSIYDIPKVLINARHKFPALFNDFTVEMPKKPNNISYDLGCLDIPNEPFIDINNLVESFATENNITRTQPIDNLVTAVGQGNMPQCPSLSKLRSHSEMDALSWLATQYRDPSFGRPAAAAAAMAVYRELFWDGFVYISCSKPSCRLCYYVLKMVPELECRPTHANVYYNWQLPRGVEGILEALRQRCSEDVMRLFNAEKPLRSTNDSEIGTVRQTISSYSMG